MGPQGLFHGAVIHTTTNEPRPKEDTMCKSTERNTQGRLELVTNLDMFARTTYGRPLIPSLFHHSANQIPAENVWRCQSTRTSLTDERINDENLLPHQASPQRPVSPTQASAPLLQFLALKQTNYCEQGHQDRLQRRRLQLGPPHLVWQTSCYGPAHRDQPR